MVEDSGHYQATMQPPEDRLRTGMVIPVIERTFYNTNWKPKEAPLGPYDMLYHPPDYDPKSARSDRRDPQITRRNIWLQEIHKPIPSTSHFVYGRPCRKIADRPEKNHVMMQVKNQYPHMRAYNVLEWAQLLYEGKELCVI